jgi:glycosyltransferase involved in cell wall biosynthesis
VKSQVLPKVTFGIIVLNGEPFTRYCLRALYPFAHEIIVVEGACKDAVAIATSDGHSTDGTLDALSTFKAEEDPRDKVRIITRDGFWSEKNEQSQAYARLATGDYLWQVDIDEFYQPEDMRAVLGMLARDPGIAAVSFKQITFWGGFDYIVDGWFLRRGAEIYRRLFKWGSGYRYVTHRPPTVHDSDGRNLNEVNWVDGYELSRRGILLHHYSLVFPKQVLDKCSYYSRAEWATHARSMAEWARLSFLGLKEPFRVHNVYDYPSWFEQFRGTHPPAIQQLIADIKGGIIQIGIRANDDVEALLKSRRYLLGRNVLKSLERVDALLGSAARLPMRVVLKGLSLACRKL